MKHFIRKQLTPFLLSYIPFMNSLRYRWWWWWWWNGSDLTSPSIARFTSISAIKQYSAWRLYFMLFTKLKYRCKVGKLQTLEVLVVARLGGVTGDVRDSPRSWQYDWSGAGPFPMRTSFTRWWWSHRRIDGAAIQDNLLPLMQSTQRPKSFFSYLSSGIHPLNWVSLAESVECAD